MKSRSYHHLLVEEASKSKYNRHKVWGKDNCDYHLEDIISGNKCTPPWSTHIYILFRVPSKN